MHASTSAARVLSFAPRRLAVLAGLCLTAACSNSSALLEPMVPAFAAGGDDVRFNPQPDPPLESHRFLVHVPQRDPGAAWSGVYLASPVDSLFVRNLAAPVRRGETLHLRQSWSLPTDTAGVAPVQMDGILNLRSGRLVLNGRTASGRTVHVLAMPVDSAAGATHAGRLTLTTPVDSAARRAPTRSR
jgi:hypothetical protein